MVSRIVLPLVLACALLPVAHAADPEPRVLQPSEIYSAYSQAAARVFIQGVRHDGTAEDTTGSALVWTEANVLVTNAHVVPPASWFKELQILARVEGYEQAWTLKEVARDEAADLVLLEPTPAQPLPTPLRPIAFVTDANATPIGTHIFVIGYQLNFGVSIVDGLIGAKQPDPPRQWITQAPMNPGVSGGPVFNAYGQIVGIATGGVTHITEGQGEVPIQGINLLVPVANVAGLLLARVQSVAQTQVLPQLPPPDAVQVKQIKRSYEFERTNDAHDSLLGTTERGYTLQFDAEPGYRIVTAELSRRSATRETDVSVDLNPDRTQATLTFKLQSGPIVDRYRGWLRGSVNTVQEKIQE